MLSTNTEWVWGRGINGRSRGIKGRKRGGKAGSEDILPSQDAAEAWGMFFLFHQFRLPSHPLSRAAEIPGSELGGIYPTLNTDRKNGSSQPGERIFLAVGDG